MDETPPDTTPTPDAAADAERKGRQHLPYLASLLFFLVVPYVVAIALPPATATVAMLVLLPVAAIVLGAVDARVFRRTWVFPITTGILCQVSLSLYANPGTWVYSLGVFLLCLAANAGAARRPGKA